MMKELEINSYYYVDCNLDHEIKLCCITKVPHGFKLSCKMAKQPEIVFHFWFYRHDYLPKILLVSKSTETENQYLKRLLDDQDSPFRQGDTIVLAENKNIATYISYALSQVDYFLRPCTNQQNFHFNV